MVLDFESILSNLKKAYNALVIKKKPEYKWTGPLLTTNKILVCCPNVDQQLNERNILYNKERGRDKVSVILTVAIQLGMQQGMEMAEEENNKFVDRVETTMERLEHVLNSVTFSEQEKLEWAMQSVKLLKDTIVVKKHCSII